MSANIFIFKRYLEKVHEFIKSNKLTATFIGIDPYRNGFTGIPFCKNEWTEFTKSVAGRIILESLGIADCNTFKGSPLVFFKEFLLENKKIAFLNLSYNYMYGKINFSEFPVIEKFYTDYNRIILKNTQNIIFCSKNKKTEILFNRLIEKDNINNIQFCYHPSARFLVNENKITYKEQWSKNSFFYLLK